MSSPHVEATAPDRTTNAAERAANKRQELDAYVAWCSQDDMEIDCGTRDAGAVLALIRIGLWGYG